MYIEFICALALVFPPEYFCTSDTSAFLMNTRLKMNTALSGHDIITMSDKEHHDCARECMTLSVCKAIDYNVRTGTCRLHNADSLSVDHSAFRYKRDSIFSDIVDWPSELVGQCGVRPCNENQRCYPTIDRYYCVDLVCQESYVTYGKVVLQAPGKNLYNDIASLKCIPRYMLASVSPNISCMLDGTWEGATCRFAEDHNCDRIRRNFHRDIALPSQRYIVNSYSYILYSYIDYPVYCLMDENGKGWQVSQRRFDGSVNFNRTWDEYQRGFGSVSGEYWLGLDYIRGMLYVDDPQDVLIQLTFEDGTRAIEIISDFKLDSDYRYSTGFKVEGNITGNVWGVFGSSNWIPFSTFDSNKSNCSGPLNGGWWFNDNKCEDLNLNGKYCSHGTACNGSYGFAYGTLSGIKESMMMLHRPYT